jgi:hypothetical protein
VLQVQAGALHAAGSKSKFKVILIPRLAWGAPVNVNVPHGTVLGPQPEIATVTIVVHKIKSFPIISASFLTITCQTPAESYTSAEAFFISFE